MSRSKSDKERKIGHRRVGVGGEITYKKIQTSQIMGSIQLGMQRIYIYIFCFRYNFFYLQESSMQSVV